MRNTVEDLDSYAQTQEIVQYQYVNPFFLSKKGSELMFTKTKIFAKDHDYMYILCLKENFNPNDHYKIKLFYDPKAEIKDLEQFSEMVQLIRAPVFIFNLSTIRRGTMQIEKPIIDVFNHKKYKLDEIELVYLMLEVVESKVKSWLKLYNSQTNLIQLIEMKVLTSYFKLNNETMENNLINMFKDIEEFKYWQNKYHCLLSSNSTFKKRKFNLKSVQKLNNKDLTSQMKKLLEQNQQNNYPDALLNGKYGNGDFSSYRLVYQEKLPITQQYIEELLATNSLNEKDKYYLMCNLLISKDYCHYVLNNKKVLDANQKILQKYKPIFRYLIGYSWISLYIEERIKKRRTIESDRYVFDIETASSLPVFPFCLDKPHLNPYFSILVAENLLQFTNNVNGAKLPLNFQRGIVNLAEFKRRLNIFISGDENIDLLEGLNWSNTAITGGTVSAIIPKINPLMVHFQQNNDLNVDLIGFELNNFFDEYYPGSDIDIACNHHNIIEFIQNMVNIKKTIYANLKKYDGNIKETDINTVSVKSLSIHVNCSVLREKSGNNELPFTIDYIIENKHKTFVKLYFYEFYLEHKKIINERNRKILGERVKDDEYVKIIDYCEVEKMALFIYDFKHKDEQIEEEDVQMTFPIYHNGKMFLKCIENLKYKLISNKLKRPFEIFRIYGKFFSCISTFHLPCVRSYYNGTNCYMLPSAITAYHTFTNLDFHYFVGSNDPINIVEKYRRRCYSTILNKDEIEQYLLYIKSQPNYIKAYSYFDQANPPAILGHLDTDHSVFKPRMNYPENYNNKPYVPKYFKMNDDENILEYYRREFGDKIDNRFLVFERVISTYGKVIPVKLWMIDAAYHIFN